MKAEVKAEFKQANVKSGTATLQFEVLTSAAGFMDLVRFAGSTVQLNVEGAQMELPIDKVTVNNNYYVNQDGEIVQDTPLIEAGDEQ